MPDVRIKDLATEVTIPAHDAYAELDGATDGSRKIKPANFGAPGLSARPGIISTGAAAVGTTQDNSGLRGGTANAGAGLVDASTEIWLQLADWTPAANKPILTKFSGNLGYKVWLLTTGVLRLEYGNGSNFSTYRFDSTVATGLADGAWACLKWTEDRDGNLVWYVNGAQLGAAVSIAAASAQTITSTGAQLWGSDGTTHTAGTWGDSNIVSNLWTATNVADIYKAGSIAPFAASFTFYQWCDFGQGYGPIIKDRSGQNQPALMGTSGLSHAVPRNPPGVPQRAPRAALVGDGSNGSKLISTLNAQNPGTGEFVLWFDGIIPVGDATGRALAALSPSAVGAASEVYAGIIGCDTTRGISTLLYSSPATEYRFTKSVDLRTHLAGKRAVIVWARAKIYLGVEGDFFDATNLFANEASASPPTLATGQVNGAYLLSYLMTGSASSAHTLYDLRLANVAMTEAQLRTEYERGEPGPEWQGADASARHTGNFSAGVDSWGTDTNQTVTGNIDTNADGAGVPPSDDWLKVAKTVSAGSLYAYRNVAISGLTGKRVRVTGSVFIPTGSPITHIRVGVISPTSITNDTARVFAVTAGATTTFDASFQTFNGGIQIGATDSAGAFASVASGTAFYLKSIVEYQSGYTARLRTDTAAGLTALNGAKSSTNDSTDFLLSTTGVTTSPDGRRQIIRPGTLTFTSPGTLNLQLFGASVVDTTKKWRLISFSGTANGAANLSLGSASAGAQYVSAKAVTAADFDVTDAQFVTRRISGANVWLASDATVTITDAMLVLERID